MVVIGVDAHKRTHTLAVVDEVGRELAGRTFPATVEGHGAALGWVRTWSERMFALEDCRHLTRRLEADLIRAGERVVRVPARLMARARRTGRAPGKSDPIDALAVARAAMRESGLPVAQLDGETRRLRLLIDHREDMVAERTRMQSRVRWHVHELFPGLEIAPRSLGRLHVIAALDRRLRQADGTVAAIARELLGRIRDLTRRINELEREITQLVRPLAPGLLAMPGCGPLSAAKIIGEVAGAARFRSKAAFARWNGTAPIPVWSGNSTRHRLNRGGNRQVNAALHRIALTQWRGVGPGRAYVQHRLAAGSTKTEALRLLRRRLSDEVFRRLLADETVTVSSSAGEEVIAA
ncbi:MAG: IS110 family transposase [Actinomycetota bacterium]